MTTRVLPNSIVDSQVDVGDQLMAFLATLTPGDVMQNPKADATFLCDRTIEALQGDAPINGIRYEWEGATIQQRTLRPYGQTRSDVTIVNGVHLLIPTGAPLIPVTCNWGWVSGPGIPAGTHIVLDYNRRGGTLSNNCVDGGGLPVTFTSQQDRSRAGLRITGKDVQLHNVTTIGPEQNPTFTPLLEAQHGVDMQGATNPQLVNVDAKHMHGDGFYPGANGGGRLTTFLNASQGTVDHCARSGTSLVNCQDVLIDQYIFDHVGRTVINFEPPNSGCIMDRVKVARSIIGQHQLTLLSSGGNAQAHVGAIELSDNWMVNDDMALWLIVGDARHQRGPYSILRNRSTYAHGFGASYPTSALICIDHAVSGSKVVDNKGFKLQPGRGMALVRSRNSGTVEVHGNDHDGGLETGPWI